MILKASSSDLGSAWQLGTTRIDIKPDGKRWPTLLRQKI
jgi:hypothetical protein